MPKGQPKKTVTVRLADTVNNLEPMGKYDDIIDYKYRGATSPKKMTMENRAAQFAPFSALSGHDEAINETARLTSEKFEPSAEEQIMLSVRHPDTR